MKIAKAVIAVVAVAVAAYFVYHVYQSRQTADMNNRAMALIDAGQFQQARTLLERATRRDPSNPVIWKNLGSACEEMSDLPKAVEAYERSLALKPNQPELRENVDVLKRAIEMGQQNAPPELNLEGELSEARKMAKVGLTYERMGDTARAIDAYKRSLALDPNQADVRRRLEALQR